MFMKRIQTFLFVFMLIPKGWVLGQDQLLEKEIILRTTSGSAEEVLEEISQKGGVTFTYGNQIELKKNITLREGKQSIRGLLDQLFLGKVEYLVRENRIILRRQVNKRGKRTGYTMTGRIKSAETGEPLLGATLFVEELSTGTATNAYGFYSLTLPKGTYTVFYSFLGYQPLKKTVVLTADTTLDVELAVATTQLKGIVVTSELQDRNVTSEETGVHKLSTRLVEAMPALGGNADIIKSIQALPGVNTIGEGSTGFFVRGGGRDQNLILLDEAPVYNPSHLLGFLSVFNTDAIHDMTLYKGGIPARFGGRASSVLDIRMKEGGTKKFNASGALGPVGGAKLTVDAPIRQGRGSFMIAGRRTYIDPVLWLLSRVEPLIEGTRIYFYDFNAKANYTLNEKNKLFVSGYFGRDVNRLPILDFDISWGNTTGTLRWNHLFNKKLFSNFTFVYSRYNYLLDIPASDVPVAWESGIRDVNVNADFTWFANPTTTLDFGLHSIHHFFDPGSNEADPQFDVPNSNAFEHGAFVSLEKEISPAVSIEVGARGSLFQNVGETTQFEYDENFEVIDTIQHAAGEFYNSFNNLEPRISARFLINKQQSIKVSYNRMAQYLHLLANSSLSFTAFDVWYPSGPNVEPLISDQVALGYFRNFRNNQIEASIEGYYKNIDNQIDYEDFAQTAFNPLVEGDLRAGTAWAYGVEFFLKKNTGKLTGWLSYTWSRAFHKIPGVNNDRPFPAVYDQPHRITTTAVYDLSKKLRLSANWVYNTGGPITLPVESYDYGGSIVPVPIYSSRNSTRLPDYHRLDLALKLNPLKNETRKVKIEYVFSIYNVYSRLNALSLYVGEDLSLDGGPGPKTPRTVANRVALLPIIPTLSFLFKY